MTNEKLIWISFQSMYYIQLIKQTRSVLKVPSADQTAAVESRSTLYIVEDDNPLISTLYDRIVEQIILPILY